MSLKVTTRAGRRVYRGAPRPLPPGACPHCTRVIAINPNGRRRAHRDLDGQRCTGSGVNVVEQPVDLTDLPPVMIPAGGGRPAKADQSPRPPQSRIPAVRARSGAEHRRTLASDGTPVPYTGGSDRDAANGRAECDTCGRHLPLNADGTLRRHRTRHQDPFAPYCTGGST